MINYDVSKLQVGEEYTYKKLCELIGAKYTGGDAKKAQLEGDGETSFKRFFDFEKIKTKFIITDNFRLAENRRAIKMCILLSLN